MGWKRTAKSFRWSGRRDSNPRRPAWEAGILPLNYSRLPCLVSNPFQPHYNIAIQRLVAGKHIASSVPRHLSLICRSGADQHRYC